MYSSAYRDTISLSSESMLWVVMGTISKASLNIRSIMLFEYHKINAISATAPKHGIILDELPFDAESKSLVHPHSGCEGENEDV
jgi:hypothetical protein